MLKGVNFNINACKAFQICILPFSFTLCVQKRALNSWFPFSYTQFSLYFFCIFVSFSISSYMIKQLPFWGTFSQTLLTLPRLNLNLVPSTLDLYVTEIALYLFLIYLFNNNIHRQSCCYFQNNNCFLNLENLDFPLWFVPLLKI